MSAPSPAIAAARAIGGESDLDAVLPALDDWRLARVIACAPEAHCLVRAIAALCGGLPSLLAPPTRADPAFHDAVAHLIGTRAGREALRAWAEMTPAGWGRAHAAALRDAVRSDMCASRVAAALIGPCDDAAALLHDPYDASSAIRRWGQLDPDGPTAWADALVPAERDRLIATVRRDSFQVASCLPWLPLDEAKQTRLDARDLNGALDAFTAASPTARTQGAAILRRLVARARPMHLLALTRLACATGADAIWRRVQTLIRRSPDDAWRVVVAAPWDDLPEDVQRVILAFANPSDVCAAIAAARRRRDPEFLDITEATSAAFFATLDPMVWDALDAVTQRRWLHELSERHGHLAVRSLGLRTEILSCVAITDDLVRAANRHADDATTLRAALLPVALRHLPPVDAHVVIASMPSPPPDPGAFFCIASGSDDWRVLAPARDALRTPGDLALAVTLQRSANRGVWVRACCAALQHALCGRSRDDLTPFMPILTTHARVVLMPDFDALPERLEHPDRRDALRQALAQLAHLPLEVSIPTHRALDRWMAWHDADAAEALADALQAHGALFLDIADAVTGDDRRAALLPLPDDPALAGALRGLAQDDPPSALRLAHALQTQDRRTALLAILTMPPRHAGAVWQALSDAARRVIDAEVAAASPDADLPAVRDPIAALALAAVHAGDDGLWTAGVAALAARPALVRAIWEHLPPKVQQSLGAIPDFADLSQSHARPAIRRGRRR